MTEKFDLILIRHGQSEANAANVFTGWSDPPLTELGRSEAAHVGQALARNGIRPARIFCSPADRTVATVDVILETLGSPAVPVARLDALKERDYGVLTGHNKKDAEAEYGAEQIWIWRRSYAMEPPGGESLRDTQARTLSCYLQTILPGALAGGATLVVSHGNTLRALCMALDDLDRAAIEGFDLPTGAALHYTLDRRTRAVGRQMLT